MIVVIMAGGAGTRFWPLSTEERPKQFLALTGDRTLLQMSYDRVVELAGPKKIFVLTSEAYVDLVREQLPELPARNIVGEPCRRDTAAAVALASLLVENRFPGETMVVLTADHVIEPIEDFHLALREAADGCGEGRLYTLGIKPTFAATQFGYLEMGEELEVGDLPHFQLSRFKEKPDAQTAESFLEAGNFYWNSGMFVWRTEDILAEFQTHLPRHLELLQPVIEKLGSQDFKQAFAQLEPISVDFAILEKAGNIGAVIPRIEWDDVGGWLATQRYLPTDDHGNALRGPVLCEGGKNNTVFVEDKTEEVLLLGVKDLVVVRSGGRTLVAHKDSLDELKPALARLHEQAPVATYP
ncbi:MAG: sugar phosphate nucleotidyltransferase [Vulcanimicrobiota bacterium]